MLLNVLKLSSLLQNISTHHLCEFKWAGRVKYTSPALSVQCLKFSKVARYGYGQAASRSMFSRRLRRRVRELTARQHRTCIRKVAKIPNPNAKILSRPLAIKVWSSVGLAQLLPYPHYQQKLKPLQRQLLVSLLRI